MLIDAGAREPSHLPDIAVPLGRGATHDLIHEPAMTIVDAALGLEAGIALAMSLAEPTPDSAAAPAPTRERPADPLEATFVAYGLRQPSLLGQDDFQVADELLHPGLRTCAARLAQGHPPSDILYEASEATRRALDVASRNLPPEEGQLLEAFGQVTRKLKLRRIDDQLVHIAKITGQVQRQNEQDEELVRLMSERVALLALRKRVVASTSGLKPPGPTV